MVTRPTSYNAFPSAPARPACKAAATSAAQAAIASQTPVSEPPSPSTQLPNGWNPNPAARCPAVAMVTQSRTVVTAPAGP